MLGEPEPEGTPGVNPNASDYTRALEAASDLVVNDGIDAVTFRSIAQRARLAEDDLADRYPTPEHLLAELIDHETQGIRRTAADQLERDPAGGLLSRIVRYSLGAMHERPLARALYLLDPESLNRIVRVTHGTDSFPRFSPDIEFLRAMREVGMIRADVDLGDLAAFLAAYMAGTAISTTENPDAVVSGVVLLLERGVDADVDDTEPGKRAFFDLVDRSQRIGLSP